MIYFHFIYRVHSNRYSLFNMNRFMMHMRTDLLATLRLARMAHSPPTHPTPQPEPHGKPSPIKGEPLGCWSCSQRLDKGGLTCQGCSKLQPLSPTVNHYDLLGLPSMRYDIELIMLEARYKSIQWLVHPDLSAARSEEERALGAHAVTRINEAFAVLKSPLLRARYLLEQKGVVMMDETTVVTDPTFLSEVMEAREEVEEAQEVGVLEGLLEGTRGRAREIIEGLGRAFEGEEVGVASDLTMKLTYLTKLEEEIRSKLPTSYTTI